MDTLTVEFQIWRSDFELHFPNHKIRVGDLYNGYLAGITIKDFNR